MELDCHAFAREQVQKPQEVLKVASKSIDGMDVYGVALADVLKAGRKLRPFGVRSAGFVLKHLAKVHGHKLSARVLVHAANSDVSHVCHVAPSLWC